MLIVGIDKGKDGAISVINELGDIIYTNPFLLHTKDEYSIERISELILCFLQTHGEEEIIFVVEDVRNIQGSSSSKNFNFGRRVGEVDGLLVMAKQSLALDHIKTILLSPRKWQKMIWIEGDKVFETKDKVNTKKTSENSFNRIFKGSIARQNKKCTTNHDGMVDSILIAEAYRRMIFNEY